ncbi:DUF3105 domain-containing protein [Pseudonocardia humida]|uniref:DUF3105 domain-containing protein n=1 Tax=Pseudonocardia humida TaxID=2800819 RepID=A0ABT1A5B2_9PSEU|nr:DUF3105 domain-containing protein [Pseudonocardia humida]MCO1658131.1 DUF3105 domain-containing protein [Pseudonocardia humida]
MVSGSKSKATRTVKPAVVRRKAPPWGLIAGVTVVVLFAATIFGYAFVQNQQAEERRQALAAYTPTAENPDPSTQLAGIQIQSFEGGVHVEPTIRVAYTFSPPIGGAHDGAWAACNGVVYPEAVRSENLVHSLEHGAVWIAYNPDLVTGDALAALTAKVQNQPYTVMSPYPGLDQPISLQAWGHQLKLADAGDPRIDQFIAALRVNSNTHPEPGASCNEIGPSGFRQDAPPPFQPIPDPTEPGVQAEVTPGAGVVSDAGTAPGTVPTGTAPATDPATGGAPAAPVPTPAPAG